MTLVNAAAPFEVPRSDHAYKWSIRLVWATGLYVAIAFCFWPGSFLTLSQMYGMKFAVNVPILLTLGIFSAGLIYGGSEPTRYAINMLTQRWRLYGPVFFFFFLGLTAFSTYKTAIPSVVCGHGHSVQGVTSGPVVVVPFETDAGPFFIEICMSAGVRSDVAAA